MTAMKEAMIKAGVVKTDSKKDKISKTVTFSSVKTDKVQDQKVTNELMKIWVR